jgi:NADPH:quinone reductase-like Zn-dependent oxidoreductase
VKAFALTSIDQPAGLVDLPVPDLAADAVRVRVRAASVNGFDVFQANGYLFSMMEHAFPTVIGRDFAGIVEAVGSRRNDVAVGDQVLGFVTSMPPLHDGTYAEVVSGHPGSCSPASPTASPSRPRQPSRSQAPPLSTQSTRLTSDPAIPWSSQVPPGGSARSPSSSPRSGARP